MDSFPDEYIFKSSEQFTLNFRSSIHGGSYENYNM